MGSNPHLLPVLMLYVVHVANGVVAQFAVAAQVA